MSLLSSIAYRLQAVERTWALAGRRRCAARLRQQRSAPYRLNIGCGHAPFEGWVNLDLDPATKADLIWDITDGLPFPDGSCDAIFSEHFLEHIPLPQAVAFMRECRRVLQPGGIVRIGMPSVAEPIRRFYEDNWREAPWLEKYGYTWIATRAEYVNICFRHWGHQWLYDVEELIRRLREAGFTQVSGMPWGESGHPAMNQRETRPETLTICEATA